MRYGRRTGAGGGGLSVDRRHADLIEFKYHKLKRSDTMDQSARAQLTRYLADDRLARQLPGVRFSGLIVVFHSWEIGALRGWFQPGLAVVVEPPIVRVLDGVSRVIGDVDQHCA